MTNGRTPFPYRTLGLAAAAAIAVTASGTAAAALEEVVVTARKTEENLQDVGVSVTPITAEVLQQNTITNIRELANQVPGLTFQESFGRRDDRPGIRGLTSIGTIDFGVESGTNIYIDGVYIAADTSAFGLHDLERVEVVRGPQSALYGRNAYAGSINFVTRRPGDEVNVRALARYGSYDEVEGSIGVSGPLTDTLAGSIFARYYSYDGQFTNPFNGSDDVGDEETQSIAGAIYFDPTENISFRARVAYSEDDDGHIPFTMAPSNTDFAGDGINPNGSDDYFVGELPSPSSLTGSDDLTGPLNEALLLQSGLERETLLITARADIAFDSGFNLILSGGYHDEDRQTGSDSAPLGTLFSGVSLLPFTDRDLEDYSFEIRLESPRDESVRYTAGFFYYHDEIVENGSSYPGIGPFTPVTPASSLADLNRSKLTRETDNWAIFGAVSLDITERLTASVEMRYSEDEKSIVGERQVFGGPLETNLFPAEETFEQGNFRVLAEYEFTDDFLGYASISRGNKPGGFNDNNNRDPAPIFPFDLTFPFTDGPIGGEQLVSFEQETSQVWEAGFKSVWLDNRLIVNASGYYSRNSDVQLTQTYLWCTTPGFGCFGPGEFRTGANIVNIPDVEIKGAELEIQAAVTDNLNVTIGYAYVDSEIESGTSRDHGRLFPPFGDAAATGPQASIAGKKFPRISEHQFNFSGTYTQPLSWGDVYLNLNGAYEDERFVQVSNLAVIPDSFLLNFRAGARFRQFEIAAWGKNILDEDSPVDGLRFRDGDNRRAFQLPNRKGAAFGVEVIADWDI